VSSIPAADEALVAQVTTKYPALKLNLLPDKEGHPLWRNLVDFAQAHTDAILLMFVHERTVLEKLFNYSVTARVADAIPIPLLALPTTHR
jgi:nucleotide-binding universal stress UspA family protein